MVTAHGVKMSPRMERLYTFLGHCKIAISSWSTDEQVVAEMPKLRAAMGAIEAELTGAHGDYPDLMEFLVSMTDAELDALAADVAAIMRRVPAARVG